MNPKNICISACVGFVLSFIIGLISRVTFGAITLRAFLFSLVFAALYVGISFLYEKFLSQPAKNVEVSDGENNSGQKSSAGNLINIVVDDSKLADDEQSPKFSVGNNRPNLGAESLIAKEAVPLNSEPVVSKETAEPSAAEKKVSESDESLKVLPSMNNEPEKKEPTQQTQEPTTAAFTPMGLDTVAKGGEPSKTVEKSAPSVSEEGVLDNLPEINDISLSGTTSGADVIKDSDFALGNSSSSAGDKSGGHDTKVLAQALRTVLAQDN